MSAFIFFAVGMAEKRQKDEAKRLIRGQELYLSHGCALCHGKAGRGDGLTAKQYYPAPIDFRDVSAYTQGSSMDAIKRSIKFGVRRQGTAMPAFDHLTEEELTSMALYLKSLQSEGEKK